jgi:DNA mismatch repair protein MutL
MAGLKMSIKVLDPITINKIAAGEVIERPSSVVKELVENSIDAKASAITVEIKDGGTSFIRITDNGGGFVKEDIPLAFLRHSTSKISSVEDLLTISSLGFRGEALSSICAVAQVELITKTHESLMGTRYVIEGGKEKNIEGIGCPDGTTFIVRNLFYNTPARKKFLKSATTEGGYISDLIERLAMSHPDISFRFISNGQNKLYTAGNGNVKDVIYHIYGKDITSNLLSVNYKGDYLSISGFIGKPAVNRGNRNFENYYINGRYIKSNIVNRAIEEAYKPFLMQHQYPFCALFFTVEPSLIDVNVHPTKMDIRFSDGDEVYKTVISELTAVLTHKEFIQTVELDKDNPAKEKAPIPQHIPEPFEKSRMEQIKEPAKVPVKEPDYIITAAAKSTNPIVNEPARYEGAADNAVNPTQLSMFEEKLLDSRNVVKHKIIGQLFDTYWIIEFEDKMYMIDQHAAHEKVLYERIMAKFENNTKASQNLLPPIIVTLSMNEAQIINQNLEYFREFGYEIEPFGGREYAITAVPLELFKLNEKAVFMEILDELTQGNYRTITSVHDRIATIACKAAVKGNNRLSYDEARSLINELLTLENPYNCPHGRPTIISMTKYEIEKKFKRII